MIISQEMAVRIEEALTVMGDHEHCLYKYPEKVPWKELLDEWRKRDHIASIAIQKVLEAFPE